MRSGARTPSPPPIEFAMVTNARTLGQRLQRRAQRGAPDLVEEALDEDHTIVGGRQGQAPRLYALFLFVHKTLRVGGMASVHTCVVEAPDAELGRFPKQLGLIKSPTERRRRSRQQHEMCETDAAFDHGFLTLA